MRKLFSTLLLRVKKSQELQLLYTHVVESRLGYPGPSVLASESAKCQWEVKILICCREYPLGRSYCKYCAYHLRGPLENEARVNPYGNVHACI